MSISKDRLIELKKLDKSDDVIENKIIEILKNDTLTFEMMKYIQENTTSEAYIYFYNSSGNKLITKEHIIDILENNKSEDKMDQAILKMLNDGNLTYNKISYLSVHLYPDAIDYIMNIYKYEPTIDKNRFIELINTNSPNSELEERILNVYNNKLYTPENNKFLKWNLTSTAYSHIFRKVNIKYSKRKIQDYISKNRQDNDTLNKLVTIINNKLLTKNDLIYFRKNTDEDAYDFFIPEDIRENIKEEEQEQEQEEQENIIQPEVFKTSFKEKLELIKNYNTEKKYVDKGTEVKNAKYGIKFYYPNPEDFKKYNLNLQHMGWNGGTKAFNSIEYKPSDLYKFVNNHFVANFDKSPFISSFDAKIRGIQPHQKFLSQFMSKKTDFNGILHFGGLGSGKTLGAILTGETNKGTFIINKVKTSKTESLCQGVLFIVPKGTIEQYEHEIGGKLVNDCIFVENDEGIMEMSNIEANRQKYFDDEQYKALCKNIETLEEMISTLTQDEKTAAINQKNILIEQEKTYKDKFAKTYENIYYIMSPYTFLNCIYDNKDGEYVLGNYLAGDKLFKTLPMGDCFRKDNFTIVIDEVHKICGKDSISYDKFYKLLNIYARNPETGEPAVKVITLTGTPIVDHPNQASKAVNLLRPRIPMPLDVRTFSEHFIDKEYNTIKNENCYKYLHSGYISYTKGANPIYFPMRRNFFVRHEMTDYQYNDYLSNLEEEIKKIGEKVLADDIYNDSDKVGQFMRTRCSSVLTPIENFDKTFQHFTDIDEILEEVGKYSQKIKYVIECILNSNGPVVVYCQFIKHGISFIANVLRKIGWDFLNTNNKKTKKPKYAIWSDTGLKDASVTDVNAYQREFKKTFNNPNNINGEYCKVLLTTVVEGIDLKNVRQVHITTPWWNNSKTEQVIGRGIRFRSHITLPEDQQYVDVFYHCSVTANKDLGQKFMSYLGTRSVEEYMYFVSNKKNIINTQFQIALQEVSVDAELNLQTNFSRFEEFMVSNEIKNKIKSHKVDKIMFDRNINAFYAVIGDDIYDLWFNSMANTIWEANEIIVQDKVDPDVRWINYEKKYIGDKLLSIIVCNRLDIFKPNLNFNELKEYAVTQLGEDENVWEYYLNKAEVNQIMKKILVEYKFINPATTTEKLSAEFRSNLSKCAINNPVLNSKLKNHRNIKHEIDNMRSKLIRANIDITNMDPEEIYDTYIDYLNLE